MAAQRAWCPALAADPDVLVSTVSAVPSGKASPETRRRVGSPTRDVGAAAAAMSVAVTKFAVEVAQHNNKVQLFDPRVALSSVIRERSATFDPIAHLTHQEPYHVLRSCNEGPAVLPVVADTTLRRAAVSAKAAGVPVSVALIRADVTPAEMLRFLDDDEALRATAGLSLRTSVRNPKTIRMLLSALNRDPEAYAKYIAEQEEKIQRHTAAEDAEDEDLADPTESAMPPPLPPISLHLTELRFFEAPFDADEGLPEQLSTFVAKPPARDMLSALELQSCGFQNPTAVQSLAAAVLESRSMTTLDLSGNGIGRDDDAATSIEALSKLLQESKFLLSVALGHNDLSGTQCKALSDALAASDTRVPTPEPDPEPEPEPYTDDLGEPEEPPQVKIGFPEEDQRAIEEPADDAKPEDGAPAEVAGEASPALPAVPDGEEEPDEEDEEEPAKPPAAPTPQGDELDEEDEERQRQAEEERVAAEEAAREEAIAAWREKMEVHIWGPERLHFEYSEYIARRALMQLHVDETTHMKELEREDRSAAKNRQLLRQKSDRERRSGWSRLRVLDLRGNPIGSEGAVALASMLRSRVPLDPVEDDAPPQDQDDASDEHSDVHDTREGHEEADEDHGDADEEEEEEDSHNDDHNNKPAEDSADVQLSSKPSNANTSETVEIHRREEQRPTHRPGMRTLRVLNISECGIGPKGAEALARTIQDNAESLVALHLANNKFAVKHRVIEAVDESREEGENTDDETPRTKPRRREPVPEWVSPAVTALSDCIAMNHSLRILDLSHNRLFPAAIAALSAGFSRNTTLHTLLLDGNPIARTFADGITVDATGFDALLAAVATMRLTSLGLSGTNLGPWLEQHGTDTGRRTAIASLLSVEVVDLSRCRVSGKGLEAVLKCDIPIEVKLNRLLLGANGMDDTEDPTLPKTLVALITLLSRRLHTLDLSDNPNLSDAALSTIVQRGLSDTPVLRCLRLRRTGCASLTAEALASLLPTVMFLEELDLGDGHMTAAAVSQHIVPAVCDATSIRRFSVWSRGTELGESVTTLLLRKMPPTLCFVDLGLSPPLDDDDDAPTEPDDEAVDPSAADGDIETALAVNRLRCSISRE